MSFPHELLIRFGMLIRHAYEHGELEKVNKIVQANGTQEWCGMNVHSMKK